MQVLTPHFFANLSARIAALQASGVDVIRLDEGAPDLPPAPHIIQTLADSAARPDAHSYQPHRGPQALRQAWAELYARLYQVQLNPSREIIPLLGSKEGIFHFLLAYVNPGDLVLAPDPGYVTYTRGALFAGGEVAYFPLLPDDGYRPDFKRIPAETAKRARLLWLNYPSNPTGATADSAVFEAALEFAHQYDLLICHDAAYSQVTFDGYQAPSILQFPGASQVAVEFNTLSKSHNMAGWRVGAALGNEQALQALFTLKTNADSGHFLPVMEAAVAALTGDQGWLAERNHVYQQRRDAVLSALHHMNLPVVTPKGSLYVWSAIPSGWQSNQFVTSLLEQTGVSLTPGTLFGRSGEGYMRISITASLERIHVAMERMETFVSQAGWVKGT
jgi:LL-diaminopimelate aminotransferase